MDKNLSHISDSEWRHQLAIWLENLQQAGMKHLSGIHLPQSLATMSKPKEKIATEVASVALESLRSGSSLAIKNSSSAPDKTPEIEADNFILDTGDSTLVAGRATTIEDLHTAFSACTRCRLAQGRHQLVFGVGNPNPRIVFIGEGPGADEDQQGEPFVGPAGRLLSGLIYALGLVREDVYITNVVKCRPPSNRNPADDEIAACLPILKRQLQLLNPRLIVALGAVAFKALFPNAAGITRARGKLTKFEQWPLLPTYHPSYLLRKPSALDECWQDFRAAFQHTYGN